MLCEYGAYDTFIDVTSIVENIFMKNGELYLPFGNKNFNKYFGDPIHGVQKMLIIHLDTNEVLCIHENDTQEFDFSNKDTNIIELMSTFDS